MTDDERWFPQRRTSPEFASQDLCDEINRVLKLFQAAAEPGATEDDRRRAIEAGQALAPHSLYDFPGQPIWFKVTIPEGTKAVLSENYNQLEHNVREFVGSEVQFAGYGNDGFQIDFRNKNTNRWLSAFKPDVRVTPMEADSSE